MKRFIKIAHCFCVLFMLLNGVVFAQQTGTITGQVLDGETKEPLWGTNVSVVGTTIGGSSGPKGQFMVEKVPFGNHALQFSYIGYELKRVEDITVNENIARNLVVELTPQAITLSQVTVTPGQFSIMGKGPTVQQTLTRQDLETVPFGEDIYRAMTRLPGISASDFSAKFTVRGGENDEILLLMDGMELLEPFHLKDIEGGALSIIDVAAVEGIDLLTGGFSAEFGDRKSGVFNIRSTRAPVGKRRTSVGLSFMNARIMSDGTFDDGNGSWLVSARRGYLDMVMALMEEEDPARPVYYDLLSKVDYQFKGKHTLSASFLHSRDKLDFVEDDDDEDNTGYGNTYGWLTFKYVPGPRLYIQSLASYGRLSHDREGIGYEGNSDILNFMVMDDKKVDMFGFKQDWNLDIADRWYLKCGFDYKNLKASYDYQSIISDITWLSEDTYTADTDTSRTDLNPSGNRFGAYLSNRFRIFSPLTAKIGLRYDATSYSDDKLFSPRVNVAYALRKQTFLRAGWGYYYQSQGIHEMRIQDGESRFHQAELAKHWVAGLEHTFRNGVNLRLEGYYKKLSDLRPDYRNWSNTIEIFPEAQYDRFKLNFRGATSKGIEAYLKYDRGGKLTWWTSYALAQVNEDITSLVFDGIEYPGGKEFPGRYDQRHSFYLDLNYRPNRKWHLNTAWQFHTGWPYTESFLQSRQMPDGSVQYYQSLGEFNGANYPSYHRLDFTANRHFHTSKGRISVFLALINVYNHGNVRNIEYEWRWDNTNQRPFLVGVEEHWFKLLPSIGVSWSWDH